MKREITTAEAHGWLGERYANEPFVRVLPVGETPRSMAVTLSNFCDVGVVADTYAKTLIVISAIDNLTKGASGQAIQAMNVPHGFAETMGLMG